MAKGYIFESSKPASVKKREAAERKRKRSEAAKKGWETLRKKQASQKKTGAAAAEDTKILNRIKYLNKRISRYGDPDNVLSLLPPEVLTPKGKISGTVKSREFFRGRSQLLDRIAAQIRKHPVSNDIREAFEETLHDIYDQISEIGSAEFHRIMGTDLTDALRRDTDSDMKMTDVIQEWNASRSKISAYYEDQIRTGKLTPFTD